MKKPIIWVMVMAVVILAVTFTVLSVDRQRYLNSDLISAVNQMDAAGVNDLLKKGADPNTRLDEGGDDDNLWEKLLKGITGSKNRNGGLLDFAERNVEIYRRAAANDRSDMAN